MSEILKLAEEHRVEDEIERIAKCLHGNVSPGDGWVGGFTLSQRVRILRRSKELRSEAIARIRAKNLARKAKIRSMTRGDNRQPCIACGASRLICQQHHIHPVANSNPDDPNCTRYVWLCPNCHTTLHICEREFSLVTWGILLGEGLLEGSRADVIHDLLLEMKGLV